MADAAVEFLLGNLKQLVVYNAHLISSVKEQLESLCEDLRLLAALVKETTGGKDAVVGELVRQIRIAVYKAEDIVDTYVFHASIQKPITRFFNTLHTPDYAIKLRSVAKEIQDIRGRVKEIHLNTLSANEVFKSTTILSRIPPCVEEEEDVVGFDKEAEKVVGWLKAATDELEVISVVGMGGLGKTTLVRKVYNDPSVQYEFFIRSWVYVSQLYSTREVFLKILYDVTSEDKDMSQSNEETITDELRSIMKDRKYLIVLDDIWTEKAWDDLKIVFPNSKNGIRILIMSRNTNVAVHANTTLNPYQLQFLNDDERWELLKKKVF